MMTAMTTKEQRDHKAMLWRNIRRERRRCWEHAELLERVFHHMLALKLPRITRKP
jgi:hypothetical protein